MTFEKICIAVIIFCLLIMTAGTVMAKLHILF